MPFTRSTGLPPDAADTVSPHLRSFKAEWRLNYPILVAHSRQPAVEALLASSSGTDDWEEDMLGRDVLEDGETFEANIDDGTGACRFDFKCVLVSGAEIVRNNVNACRIGTFTFKS